MKTNFIKLKRSSRILTLEQRINHYLGRMVKFGNKMLKAGCYWLHTYIVVSNYTALTLTLT